QNAETCRKCNVNAVQSESGFSVCQKNFACSEEIVGDGVKASPTCPASKVTGCCKIKILSFLVLPIEMLAPSPPRRGRGDKYQRTLHYSLGGRCRSVLTDLRYAPTLRPAFASPRTLRPLSIALVVLIYRV